ncbi:hypothetical protein LSH36_207g07067 [Paralvinella palmiformis]|uniref:Uncharacterized protein n=1 Tax=Paralvinella palmiformis TaxID=53620 RepID=A0AAD9JQF0_9ANNE|nr:hypothetical protein LSH36_207g07067 [Paralvinella palmiformis]
MLFHDLTNHVELIQMVVNLVIQLVHGEKRVSHRISRDAFEGYLDCQIKSIADTVYHTIYLVAGISRSKCTATPIAYLRNLISILLVSMSAHSNTAYRNSVSLASIWMSNIINGHIYNHVQPASKLSPGCDYSLFKDGIQPMWEDELNKKGGRWLINLDKRKRFQQLDTFWLETLLCLIGEAFEDYSDEICGAVVNIRNKGDKLALWTHDATKKEATVKIGEKIKERLNIPQDLTIGYQAHQDTMTKSGSTAKNVYIV